MLVAARPASAGIGFRVTLPAWPQTPAAPGTVITPPPTGAPTTPKTGNNTGLVLTLDTTWVEGNGYRPVRITITPVSPTAADRLLRVSFRPGTYRGPAMAITRDIELPAGFTSVTITLSAPQIDPWQTIAFDVFEDGEHVRELSIPQNSMTVALNQYWGDNASPVLLVLNTSANTSTLLNALGRAGQQVLQVGKTNTTSTSLIYMPGNPPRQATVNLTNTIATFADLPDRWIDYSGLDVILASRQDLQTLVERHPSQWLAIRRWIATGGNLWVYGAGEIQGQDWSRWNLNTEKPWAHLDAINKWIRFPAGDDESPWKDIEPALVGWRAPDLNAPNVDPNRYAVGPQTFTIEEGVERAAPRQLSPDPKEPKFPFALRSLGEGTVVAIPDDAATSDPRFPWRLVFNNTASHWSTRHGVNFSSQNDNYWNFLIPGVGAAPVSAFQILITLFVLTIGPLNFYLLRRWNKLNLLLITVPASAAVVTAALLLYATLSDGFGVRVRTRSYTYLDQRNGEAACFGRITYYAGLTPAKGLSFSGDVTVYPLTQEPLNTLYESNSALVRRLAWEFEGDGVDKSVGRQQLESGWLQSRIQTQLVTVRSRKTAARLEIATNGDRATAVTNQLGAPVWLLVVRDAAGGYCVARDVEADAQAELTELAEGDLVSELTRLGREKELHPPDGMELAGSQTIFGFRRGRVYYNRPYTGTIQTGMTTVEAPEVGILERGLSDSIRKAMLRQLPPRSYVAIVSRSPEFELGLESANDESSFHVIYGRW